MITFDCPRCQHCYEMSDRQSGRKFACYTCQQRLQVPAPPRAEAQSTDGPSVAILALIATGVGVCVLLLVASAAFFFYAPPSGPNEPIAAAAPIKSKPKLPFAKLPDPTEKSDPAAPLGSTDLAQKVHALFKADCYRCHGESGAAEGGVNFILDAAALAARKKVVPGSPEKSRLWRRVAQDEMPPEGEKPRRVHSEKVVAFSGISANLWSADIRTAPTGKRGNA